MVIQRYAITNQEFYLILQTEEVYRLRYRRLKLPLSWGLTSHRSSSNQGEIKQRFTFAKKEPRKLILQLF